jgi:cell division topological specificity factor
VSFVRRLFGEDRSARSAKERLKLVLVHDRANLSQARLAEMKDEMIEVISRYVSIDRSGVEIALTNDRHEQRLVADIPLLRDRQKRD